MKKMGLFRKKRVRLETVKLDMMEYDKLIDSKLLGIRKFMYSNIQVRENDDLFAKQFEEAFLKYEKTIKEQISHEGDVGKILVSPFTSLSVLLENLQSPNSVIKKLPWYKRKIRIKKFVKKIKFKIQLYWKHLLLLREIHKIKKLFPNINNKHALNLLNASKLNKRMLKKHI